MLEIFAYAIIILTVYIYCMAVANGVRTLKAAYALDTVRRKLRWFVATKANNISFEDQEFQLIDGLIDKASKMLPRLNVWFVLYFAIRHRKEHLKEHLKLQRIKKSQLRPFYDEYTKILTDYLFIKSVVSLRLFIPIVSFFSWSNVSSSSRDNASRMAKYIGVLPETKHLKTGSRFNARTRRTTVAH